MIDECMKGFVCCLLGRMKRRGITLDLEAQISPRIDASESALRQSHHIPCGTAYVPLQHKHGALDQVLNTTELLEMMLLNLPVNDLLFCQRAGKMFRDTIDRSISLQRVLFLAPTEAFPANKKPIRNSFLDGGRMSWTLLESGGRLFYFAQRSLTWQNQTLYETENPRVGQDADGNEHLIIVELREAPMCWKVGTDAVVIITGSWKMMYLCQKVCCIGLKFFQLTGEYKTKVMPSMTLGRLLESVAEDTHLSGRR